MSTITSSQTIQLILSDTMRVETNHTIAKAVDRTGRKAIDDGEESDDLTIPRSTTEGNSNVSRDHCRFGTFMGQVSESNEGRVHTAAPCFRGGKHPGHY